MTGVYSAAPLPPPAPAFNPGRRIERSRENELKEKIIRESEEEIREIIRTAHAPEHIFELVRSKPEESDEARRARILKLAREIYSPAEEGHPEAVQVLSTLSDVDRELYRRARHSILDKEERELLLTEPKLIRDKVKRIERLSALRWGTPCAEVEALIVATLRGGAGNAGGMEGTGRLGIDASTSRATVGERQTERYNFSPQFTELDEQEYEQDEQAEGQQNV